MTRETKLKKIEIIFFFPLSPSPPILLRHCETSTNLKTWYYRCLELIQDKSKCSLSLYSLNNLISITI